VTVTPLVSCRSSPSLFARSQRLLAFLSVLLPSPVQSKFSFVRPFLPLPHTMPQDSSDSTGEGASATLRGSQSPGTHNQLPPPLPPTSTVPPPPSLTHPLPPMFVTTQSTSSQQSTAKEESSDIPPMVLGFVASSFTFGKSFLGSARFGRSLGLALTVCGFPFGDLPLFAPLS
jgi:hypothetical protein